jgi:hypothetical protein
MFTWPVSAFYSLAVIFDFFYCGITFSAEKLRISTFWYKLLAIIDDFLQKYKIFKPIEAYEDSLQIS